MASFNYLIAALMLVLSAPRGVAADVFVMFTGPDGNEIDFDVEQDPTSGEWEVYLRTPNTIAV